MQNEEQNLFKASQKSQFLIMMFKYVFGLSYILFCFFSFV